MKGRCLRLAVAWLVAACLLPAARPALCAKKEPVRIAVVAGSNLGAGDERPLKYAEDDATKMSRVLTEVAGFDKGRVFAVLGHDRTALLDAMTKADRSAILPVTRTARCSCCSTSPATRTGWGWSLETTGSSSPR